MDNVIGTNQIGEALGLDWDPQEDAFLGVMQHDLAVEQFLQMAPYYDSHDEYGMVGAPPPARGPARGPARVPARVPAKGPARIPLKVSAKGPTSSKTVQSYTRGLDNVHGAAEHAKKVGTKVVSVGTAYKASEHKPLAVVTHKGVHGIFGVVNDVVLGLAPKQLSPKQSAAVAAHSNSINRTRAAATEAIKIGNRAIAAGKAAGTTAKKVKTVFDAASKPGTKPGIHGILGMYDALGADDAFGVIGIEGVIGLEGVLGVDASGRSQGDPGYDPTTDPESPQFAGGGGGFAPDPTLYTPERWGLPPFYPRYTGLDGDNPDPNLTPVPADNPYTDVNGANPAPGLKQPLKGGGKLSQKDAEVTWRDVPEDVVVYDGSKGWQRYSKGSHLYFYGPQNANGGQFGMVWGYDHMNWPSSTASRWIKRFGQADVTNNDNWDDGFADDKAAAAASAASDPRNNNTGKAYGPLIGNPNSELAGLQFASGPGVWFWQSQNAPSWACGEINAKISDINAATLKKANDAANAANKALADANAAILAADNAAIDAGNANTEQLMNQFAEALLKQRAASELQQTTDAAAEAHTVSQVEQNRAVEQQKADTQSAQQQLDESARASQLEAELARAQSQQETLQAQFEQQYLLADQQMQAQLAPLQMQQDTMLAQMLMQQPPQQYGGGTAPSQDSGQMDALLLQMLMQQPPQQYGDGPSQDSGQMDALLLQMLMQQEGVSAPSQTPPSQMEGFDPNAYYAGFEGLQDPSQALGIDPSQAYGFDPSQAYGFDPSQAYGFDPLQANGFDPSQDPSQAYGFDPSQLPGSFDMSAYW